MTTPNEHVYRLQNPIKPPKQDEGVKLNSPWMDANEYNYLFRQVLAGVHGSQSAIIGTVIHKLNTKLRSLNVNAHYDPNNEHIVARLLHFLNFDEPVANDTAGVAGPSDRKPRGSAGPRAKRGATPSVRGGESDKTHKRTDTASGTQDRK